MIGQAAGVTPVIVDAMLASAREHLKASVGYATLNDETSDHGRLAGQPWNIRFSGVVDPLNTSSTDFTFTTSNFFPERTHQAADYYRAALRADPSNRQAANGLLRTYYERMAAMTYGGHNGAERTARIRLLFGDIDAEITALERDTLSFYGRASDELSILTSRLVEAQLFDGSDAHIPMAELAGNLRRLNEVGARALTHQAETVLQLGRLKQMSSYSNPLLESSISFTPLVAELSERRNVIKEVLLLFEASPELTEVARGELSRCRRLVDQIQNLESSIENGRITFLASHNEGSTDEPSLQFNFHEFASDYVPFHALNSQGQRSHDQFLSIASGFRGWAVDRENQARALVRDFDVQSAAHTSSLNEITNRYFRELAALCGQIRAADNGALVPDVVLALFPETERLALHPYTSPGESTGEIGLQWKRIDQAQAELEVAEQDLESLYSQVEKKGEVAVEMADGIENLARLFLVNGEKLEGLDKRAGRLQADAAIQRAKSQQRNGFLSGLKSALGVISMAAIGAATGGVGAAAAAAVASPTLWKAGAQGVSSALGAQDANSKTMKSAKIDAKLAKNLAKINAQRTRIATLERVAVQYQQRDQLLLQTEEALHSLLLQIERQKLTILLAEQRVDSELLTMQNLVGRVQSLLAEFANALGLQQQNPLNSPDYRLVRDLTWREAEDSFHLAHRWVYLAAKSVEYRLNSAGSSDGSSISDAARIRSRLSSILRARNAATLDSASQRLKDELDSFYTRVNREIPSGDPDYLSLRNHLVQRNRLNPTNDTSILVEERQPGGVSSANHWQTFLQSNLATLPNNHVGLIIPFSTSYESWSFTTNALGGNPLFSATSHGDLIDTIEVQVVGRALTQIGQFRYALRYVGTSTVRQEQCLSDGNRAIRYWNIRRPDGTPYRTDGPLGVNNWQNTATAGFREFSSANDRWVLEIATDLPNSAGNRNLVTTDLGKIEDIRIRFRTNYFPADRCD